MVKSYNNNYSTIERNFFKRTKLAITSGYSSSVKLSMRVSIIVTNYYNLDKIKKVLAGLNNQYIDRNMRDKIEIIIVDDGSSDFNKLCALVKKDKNLFNVKLAHFKENQGRSSARNLGAILSAGEILLFLDGDIIPNKFWLISHIMRQELYNNIAMVGFNETIDIGDKRISYKNLTTNFSSILPNYKKDFRYKKFVPSEWHSIRSEIDNKYFNKLYFVLNESDKFKNFDQDTPFGIWDLPFMLLSGNFSIRKKQFAKIGGFSFDFKGWGMEDTYLGFRLITNGIFIIPILSATGFHILNKEHKYSKRLREFKKNLKIYRKNIKLNPKNLSYKSWLTGISRRFNGKYFVASIKS